MGYDRYITEDPALGLPEAEKALKALIGVLKTCLILSRERAEKLCMDLDSYRGYRSDSAEDESLAQTAFEDDVDHAEEILAWRAVVVAELVGEALSGYAKSHSPLDDPWLAWRTASIEEPNAGVFVYRREMLPEVRRLKIPLDKRIGFG